MAPLFFRFQTKELSIWTIQRNAEIGFDFGNGKPLQIRWNWEIMSILKVFVPISMGFSQI